MKDFLEPISYLIYTVLLVITIQRDKVIKNKVLLCYYFVVTLIISYASLLSFYRTKGDNNWIYNIFFLITICVLSYYFDQILFGKLKRYIVCFVLILNLILFVIYDVILNEFFKENNYVRAFCFFSIVIYSLLYFYQIIRNVTEANILHLFDFWLVSGYLIYFLGCFCIILYYKYPGPKERGLLWSLQNIILFLASIITLCGNYWSQKQRRLS